MMQQLQGVSILQRPQEDLLKAKQENTNLQAQQGYHMAQWVPLVHIMQSLKGTLPRWRLHSSNIRHQRRFVFLVCLGVAKTNMELVSPIFYSTWVYRMRILHLCYMSRVWACKDNIVSDAIGVYVPSKNPHT